MITIRRKLSNFGFNEPLSRDSLDLVIHLFNSFQQEKKEKEKFIKLFQNENYREEINQLISQINQLENKILIFQKENQSKSNSNSNSNSNQKIKKILKENEELKQNQKKMYLEIKNLKKKNKNLKEIFQKQSKEFISLQKIQNQTNLKLDYLQKNEKSLKKENLEKTKKYGKWKNKFHQKFKEDLNK
ncbi:hypothetical protein M0811_00378 [Anaeramoeba ignava]|uniref:Uncharacterized protein n=1 Tax=Anaeramoeba ignava TaxID=1746090 RepID=A0A9Q0LQD8_ANAIG|nr:hypothetical protein M0811_00378 [Anaeramoeba ignava]